MPLWKEQADAMAEEELKRPGVGSSEFMRKCQELDDMIERARSCFFTNKLKWTTHVL